jgi:S-adenosylmethionine-diacylglycerol 3-amino-3-carboxypropyl transferase
VITSGGDNALALAMEAPRSVTAIDLNPAQTHLLELKIAAILALEHDDLLGFLGVRDAVDRPATYARRVAPRLSPEARAFWDGRQDPIARGVIHSGRFERYLALFRRTVLPLMERRADIDRLLALREADEQRRFYDEVWANRRWNALFVLFFGRALQSRLGRHPEVFRYVEVRDVGRHYRERARHALAELPLADNHFVEYILTGAYRSETRVPDYLCPGAHARLREATSRIRLRTVDVGRFLHEASAGAYSAFAFSDVFEWMSQAEYEGTLRAAVRASREGARLCYYNNLVVRRPPPSFAGELEPDEALGRALHFADRSFLYGRFAIERIRLAAAC